MNKINTNPREILQARSVMIDYTRDQAKALIHISTFLESKDNFYLLIGNAGTGKTTIAENIARYSNASMLAPTNAAIKRLKDKFMCEEIPRNRFQTIHQTLYGAPNEETGEFEPKEGLRNSPVYIVDESSMIEKKILDDLIKEALKSNKKLIFMGDDFQLEPVGEDPVLFKWEESLSSINNIFKQHWRFKLNEVKRNQGTILAIATHLRNSENCSVLEYDNEDFQIVSRFSSNLPLCISHMTDFVVLVSTNRRRIKYNEQIRIAKFEEDAKKVVVDGEKLISVSNQQYLNGEMYTIKYPKVTKEFKAIINVGSKKYPELAEYKFYLVEHEIEGTVSTHRTLMVPNLNKASLHPSQLMHIKEIYSDYNIVDYNPKMRKKVWNKNINIATYGYATSVHKSQGNEWDTVYIDCDWLSPNWNHARWLYTAITRAKKRVELKNSSYFNIIPKKDG